MKTKYKNLLAIAVVAVTSNFSLAQFQFAKVFGISGKNEIIESTAIDGQGNVFLTGRYYNNTQFETETMEQSAVDYTGAYLTKQNSSGQIQWFKSYRASEGIERPLLTVNANGDVFFVGKYRGDLTFGTTTINSGSNNFGGGSIFVVKFNNAGTILWIKSIESKNAQPRDLVTDANGDLYLAGAFDEKIMLEGTNELTAWSGLIFESFAMKLSGNDGTIAWGFKTNSKRESGVKAITVDNAGSVYLSGFFNDSLRFSPTVAFPCVSAHASISATNATNGFLAKYDASNGNFIWAKHIKGQIGQGTNLAWCNNNLYATYIATHYFNYDSDSIAAGNYLLKIDPTNGNKIFQKGSSHFNALAADGDNAVYFTNDASNTYSFDSYTTTDGKSGMALGKLNNNGDLEWVEIRGSFGTTMRADANSLYAKDGAVFIGGSITAFTPVAFEPGMEIMPTETLYLDAWYALYNGTGGPVGIAEHFSSEEFTVYPNPASGTVFIYTENISGQVSLMDLNGKILLAKQTEAGKTSLDLDDVPAGVYMVQIQTATGLVSKKLIVN